MDKTFQNDLVGGKLLGVQQSTAWTAGYGKRGYILLVVLCIPRGITKTTPPPLWKMAFQPVFLPLYRRAILQSAEALYQSHPTPSGSTAISRYRSHKAFLDLPLSILHDLDDASLLTNSRAPCKALNPHFLARLCFGEGPQCLCGRRPLTGHLLPGPHELAARF